jgi:hypothetical protein
MSTTPHIKKILLEIEITPAKDRQSAINRFFPVTKAALERGRIQPSGSRSASTSRVMTRSQSQVEITP